MTSLYKLSLSTPNSDWLPASSNPGPRQNPHHFTSVWVWTIRHLSSIQHKLSREAEQCDTSIFRSYPLDPLLCQPRQPHNVQKLQHLRVYLINSLFLTPPQWPPSETWRHVLLVLLLWAQNLQCFWSPDTVCCFSISSSTNVQKPKTIQWHHLDLLSMCFGKRRWIHGPIDLYGHTAGIRRFWSLLCRISGTTSSTSNVCGEENSLKSKLKHHFVVVDGGLWYYFLQSLCISLVSNLY